MAVVDPDDDAFARFVAQRRDELPDENGQRWHDVVGFDSAGELQKFLDARRAENPTQTDTARWRSSVRPVGYLRSRADERELKRAFAHGARPSAEVWSRMSEQVVTSVRREPDPEISR